MENTIAQNKAVVAQFDELGNQGGDLAKLDILCAPDMINHSLAPGYPQGLEGTRDFLRGFEAPAGTATRDVTFAYRLVDGRIAERWAIRDDLTMLVQLRAPRLIG
jgi:hypothetical protein